jgi:hypothetical protein
MPFLVGQLSVLEILFSARSTDGLAVKQAILAV